jgi:hypothetical protein
LYADDVFRGLAVGLAGGFTSRLLGVSPGGGLVVFSVLLLGLGFLIGGAADAKAAAAASRVFLQFYPAGPSSWDSSPGLTSARGSRTGLATRPCAVW